MSGYVCSSTFLLCACLASALSEQLEAHNRYISLNPNQSVNPFESTLSASWPLTPHQPVPDLQRIASFPPSSIHWPLWCQDGSIKTSLRQVRGSEVVFDPTGLLPGDDAERRRHFGPASAFPGLNRTGRVTETSSGMMTVCMCVCRSTYVSASSGSVHVI